MWTSSSDWMLRMSGPCLRVVIEAVPLTKQICLCYSVAGLSTGVEKWLTVLL